MLRGWRAASDLPVVRAGLQTIGNDYLIHRTCCCPLLPAVICCFRGPFVRDPDESSGRYAIARWTNCKMDHMPPGHPWTAAFRCYPEGCTAPGSVPCQSSARGPLSKLERTPPQRKIDATSKSPVGDISVVTLIRTDTTLDHSQKAEKVCSPWGPRLVPLVTRPCACTPRGPNFQRTPPPPLES